jgi:hypothetical protein
MLSGVTITEIDGGAWEKISGNLRPGWKLILLCAASGGSYKTFSYS